MTEIQSAPWYKEKWVWLLIAIPGSSILFGIFMITMAVSGKDSLVRDDYYKDGLMINQELQRDQKAYDMGLTASLQISDQTISVTLSDPATVPAGQLLKLRLLHPTLADNDLDIMLVPNGDHFRGSYSQAIEGKRYLQLSDQNDVWRLKGESWLPREDSILLEPSVSQTNE
ncbi:FixH family protein [Hahella ganghwensis]|uniref:FixH family protein n=1 Tax=Hahella ganghwensis TaxID=286420 RepID=UPI00037D1346|nr:FixH family protein [Hahella ganghwensis]